MKKLLPLLFLFFLNFQGFSQGAPACPNVTTGPTQTICGGQTATLTSTLVTSYATTTYSVSAIPYAPYPYTGTAINVGTDDVWSPAQNLLFPFCFFGNTYTQCVIGANGHITFDLTYASGYDSWPCNAALPSTANMPANTINAVFRDIDPALGGNTYYLTGGASPCRYVVISWSNVPLFNKGSGTCDGTPNSTFQMVLYENTNFIDVYIGNSFSCAGWNGGNGIVGIQNATASTAVCPPGRNNTTFSVNGTPEAWRFTPTGAPSYTFNWSAPGAPNFSTTNSVAVSPTVTTTYTASMVITNCDGSTFTTTATEQVVVNNPATITATDFTTCPGGAVTLTAVSTPTTIPVAFNWSTGATTNTISVSPGATTSYTVTGATASCTNTAVATVTVVPTPTVTVNNATVCSGGTATLTANGATTYNWTAGTTPTTGSVVTVSPGATTSYTVTGTTGTCTNSAVSTVTIASTLSLSVAGGAICNGQTTLTLTANSNAASFAWSPATGLSTTTGSAVVANPTTTQTYTIVGTSGTCTVGTTAVVTVHNPPTLTTTSSSMCAGQQTGTVTVNGASTYTWTGGGINGNTTTNPTDNPANTTVYTVNATDVNTCTNTATATITVNTPPTLTVTSASICNGAGPATLGVNGASTYTWAGGGITGSHSTAPSDNPAVTTIYTVNGTDVNTCTATATGTINVMNTPTISVSGAGAICNGQTTLTLTANSDATSFAWSPTTGLSATTGSAVVANPTTSQNYTIVGTAGTCTVSTTAAVTVHNPPVLATTSSTICVGQQVGSVTVGGASTYTWTGGGITGNTTINPSDNPVNTTVYTVNAADVNTCTATATATITVNPLPVVTVNSSTICLGQQTATLTAAGASTYSWPAGLSSTTGATVTGAPAVTTPYTVTGTDANGCTATAVAQITVISNPTITVGSGAMCVGQQTVALTANSNATSFVWSPATGLSATTGSTVTANPTTIGPNTYTIVGTAAGSCTVSTTAVVTVYALPVPTASTNVPCETEQPLNLTCTPTGTYTYTWSGPNTFTSNIQNPSITNLGSVTQAAAGTYTVLVTDNNSCYNSTTVTVVINPKPVITATGATVCVGQTINLSSSGAGVGGVYVWNGPNTYSSSPNPNPSIANSTVVMTGIYNVVGTDANGCYSAAAIQVQVNALPIISIANSGPMCVGQETTTLTATSTNGGTTYTWAPATALSATTGSVVIANPSPAGTYTYLITGTDANTCVGTFSASVLVNPTPTITVNSDTICIGEQTATLTATSTNAGTTYNWTPATGLSSTTNTVVTGTPTVTTNYVITGTDGNGCVSTGNASILVNILPTITATSGTICTGQTTTLTASSTNAGTTYSWAPAIGLTPTIGATVAANPTVTTTSQNYSYTVTGTDANGCINTGSSHVLVYSLPVVTVTSATICMGQQTATLTASGAYTYTWTPTNSLSNSTGAVVHGFPVIVGTNNYTVTATDAHTCVNIATTSIWVNSLPTVTINTVSPECVPFCKTLTATPTPGNSTYTYNWDLGNGQTSQVANPVACYSVANVYAVKLLITDANGCTTTTSTPVNALVVPVADFDYGQQPVSILAPEVQFNNESTYGLPNHSWNFGDVYSNSSHDTSSVNNPSHMYAEVGTYNVTLTVSTANGCSATVVKPVIINEDYAIYVPNAFSPNGDGKNEIFKADGEGVKDYKLFVFDRWGLLLFYSDDINKGWDGKIQGGSDVVQEDTYVWKIQTTDFKSKSKNLQGTVTLLK